MRFVHKLISTNESTRQALELGAQRDEAKHQRSVHIGGDEHKAQMEKRMRKEQHSTARRQGKGCPFNLGLR